MPGLVRRPIVIWLLAALAVPVLLTAVLIPARAGTTEDDLRDQTVAALQARGIESGSVDFDGRDAKIVVPAGVDPDLVREVVGTVEGVRSVRIEGESTTPTPRRASRQPSRPSHRSRSAGRISRSGCRPR